MCLHEDMNLYFLWNNIKGMKKYLRSFWWFLNWYLWCWYLNNLPPTSSHFFNINLNSYFLKYKYNKLMLSNIDYFWTVIATQLFLHTRIMTFKNLISLSNLLGAVLRYIYIYISNSFEYCFTSLFATLSVLLNPAMFLRNQERQMFPND